MIKRILNSNVFQFFLDKFFMVLAITGWTICLIVAAIITFIAFCCKTLAA